MTEAQKKASKKYDAVNTRTFTIKLNYNTDADAIAYLETQGNVQGLIKCLIREKIGGLTKMYTVAQEIEWISVNDALPTDDEKKLVITQTQKGIRSFNLAYYSKTGWHGMGSMSCVIYWANLPDISEVTA